MENQIEMILEDSPWLGDNPDSGFKNHLSQHLNAQNWRSVFYCVKDYIDCERTLVKAGGRKEPKAAVEREAANCNASIGTTRRSV